MATLSLIGIIITSIVGPMLLFFLQRYSEKKLEDNKAADRQKREEKDSIHNDDKIADRTRDINESIRKQRERMKKD